MILMTGEAVQTIGSMFFKARRTKKISDSTLAFMEERRQMFLKISDDTCRYWGLDR